MQLQTSLSLPMLIDADLVAIAATDVVVDDASPEYVAVTGNLYIYITNG